jgi:hypothetical protein
MLKVSPPTPSWDTPSICAELYGMHSGECAGFVSEDNTKFVDDMDAAIHAYIEHEMILRSTIILE